MSDPSSSSYTLLPDEDLRRLISSTNTTSNPPPAPVLASSLSLYGAGGSVSGGATSFSPGLNYCYNPPPPPIMVGDVFYPRSSNYNNYDYSSSTLNHPGSSDGFCGNLDNNQGWLGNFDSSTNNRWPRQETLSLLEIRSRLHSEFRDNNQKAPLWNQISRIMGEEFGYQRSGKKCKEKFENLYKYYKKTKEGKASRQDGKHYRFFRQLEAICGESSNTNTHHASTLDKITSHANDLVATQTPSFTINQENINDGVDQNLINNAKDKSKSLSFSNSDEFEIETSSSENNDNDLSVIAERMKLSKNKGLEKSGGRVGKKSWRTKVEEIVDSHMKKIIETQDAWMERMMSVVEKREEEMATKEEERKRKESMRFDQEIHELWVKEKAWVEARDVALLEVVRKHIGIESSNKNENENYEYPFENVNNVHRWTEMEISNLIQLRSGFEQQVIREKGYLDDGVWDEIGEKMVCMGFNRNGVECKKIWDEINMSLRKKVDYEVKSTRPWCLGLKVTGEDDI